MQLTTEEKHDFMRLHAGLLFYLYRQAPDTSPAVDSAEEYMTLPSEIRIYQHMQLSTDPACIDAYLQANPDDLPKADLDEISSWRHMKTDTFCIFRHLKKYTVLIPTEGPEALYGVVGINEPIQDVLGTTQPLMLETTLMPFRGKITYDGYFRGQMIMLGRNYAASFNELYKRLKAGRGIVTDLLDADTSTSKTPRKRPRKKKGWTGRWRIASMEMWDQDFVDAEVPGYFNLKKSLRGDFQFGYVYGELDLEVNEEGESVRIDFTFEGNDEMDPCSGRGVIHITEGKGKGKLYFHRGDHSGFELVPM